MSRLTENFSIYSAMSIRTIDFSSSNKYSARARASSVFPTPVGPRNKNEPIGLLGSDNPARLRRMAFAVAVTASSCPITRWCNRSSRCTSLCISPSSNLFSGTPVHFDTTSAMSSASTSSFSIRFEICKELSCVVASLIRRSTSGIRPYRISAAFSKSSSRST